MSITLELSPDMEARLRRRAERQGQDFNAYLLNIMEREAQAEPDLIDASEGTAAELFAGRLGRIHSGGEGRWSENCGEKFAEGMEEKTAAGPPVRQANGWAMPSVVLTDTGPLVALIDADDFHHVQAVQTLQTLSKVSLLTTWPCLTEAMYLLGKAAGHAAQEELWQFVEDRLVNLHIPSPDEWVRMRALMAQYNDIPMDMADASLMAAAETRNATHMFTFDGHFYAYRTASGRALHVVP